MKKITTLTRESDIKREFHTPAELRVRESGEGEASSRTIEGYAIRFDTPSAPLWDDGDEELREIIDRSAVTQELLDSSDIKFTMFHDRQLLLARSKQGKGTLSYTIDERGVAFSFDAPHTPDGDKALELVRSGIIDGCSFAFTTRYYDSAFVERTVERKDGKSYITCRVKVITGVYDMTITPDPAYPATEVDVRDLATDLRHLSTKRLAREEAADSGHLSTNRLAREEAADSGLLSTNRLAREEAAGDSAGTKGEPGPDLREYFRSMRAAASKKI